jgi:hypothetical protein
MGIEQRKRDNLRVDFSPKHTLGRILLNLFKKEAIRSPFFILSTIYQKRTYYE